MKTNWFTILAFVSNQGIAKWGGGFALPKSGTFIRRFLNMYMFKITGASSIPVIVEEKNVAIHIWFNFIFRKVASFIQPHVSGLKVLSLEQLRK